MNDIEWKFDPADIDKPSKPSVFRGQPSMFDIEKIGGVPELTEEMKYGIILAAWICRSYGEGERWAECIECYGEQVRALYWLKKGEKECG
jgi:hypothetical protein